MLALGPRIQQKNQSLLPVMQELRINLENHGLARLLKQQTSIIVYHLPAPQGIQTSVLRFPLQKTNGSLPFPFSIYIYICRYLSLYIYTAVSNSKRKTEAHVFSLIHLPFAHCANGSYSFANGLCGLNRLAHLCWKQTILSHRRLYPLREYNKVLISEICT
jgi:hypothetical protein